MNPEQILALYNVIVHDLVQRYNASTAPAHVAAPRLPPLFVVARVDGERMSTRPLPQAWSVPLLGDARLVSLLPDVLDALLKPEHPMHHKGSQIVGLQAQCVLIAHEALFEAQDSASLGPEPGAAPITDQTRQDAPPATAPWAGARGVVVMVHTTHGGHGALLMARDGRLQFSPLDLRSRVERAQPEPIVAANPRASRLH